MGYYSAIKKNTSESALMRWIKLEPIIQSEVSQKERHQYSILCHLWGRTESDVDLASCSFTELVKLFSVYIPTESGQP